MVSNRSILLEWDVSSDGRATKDTVSVLRLSHLIRTVNFVGLSEISIRGKLYFIRVSLDALACIPLLDIQRCTVSVIRRAHGLPLAEIFDSSKHVLSNCFLILNNLLDDNGFREGLLDTLGLNCLLGTV